MSEEIRELNLSYLMLAQRLLSEDRASAMFQLGLGADAADVISDLSPAQILRMSGAGMVLCQVRFDDEMLLNLLSNHDRDAGISSIHAAIVASSRPVENLA